jgi:hypothetical protein
MSEQSDNVNQGDPLSTLVGEGKKYKTVEDLARSRLEADGFIEKLKVENAALREAITSEVDPNEVLKRIEAKLNAKGSENAANRQSNQSQTAPLSEERVLELLGKREREQQQARNKQSFDAAATKAFGEKTAEVLASRLGELGMNKEMFDSLAVANPQAALRILGVKDSVGSGGLEPSVTTEAYLSDQNKGEVKNFAYFEKLRRELKEGYYVPEIQREVFKARKELGEKFWKS